MKYVSKFVEMPTHLQDYLKERRSGASAKRNSRATHNKTPELEQGERYLVFQS
jgi:hypothetical protein